MVVSSQPAVPPDASVLRANNVHKERTADENNELLRGTLQPLTQFSATNVPRGLGHIYVTAEIFNEYYSTVDSVDIQHPGGWYLRLRDRSNSADLYNTDADLRTERRQAAQDSPGTPAQPAMVPVSVRVSNAGAVCVAVSARKAGAHGPPAPWSEWGEPLAYPLYAPLSRPCHQPCPHKFCPSCPRGPSTRMHSRRRLTAPGGNTGSDYRLSPQAISAQRTCRTCYGLQRVQCHMTGSAASSASSAIA